MANSAVRRPLPALVALLALLLLTGIVWWRVISRDDSASPASCPSTPAPAAQTTLPAPATVTLVVLNATKRTGLASKVRTELVQRGFLVPQAATNDNPKKKVTGVAELRYGPKGEKAAKLLQYYLPGATLKKNNFSSATVIVSLGARFTALAAPTAVSRALTEDKVAVASPAPSGSGSQSGAGSGAPSGSPSGSAAASC